ncbi:2-hydroxyacid dehydrogenase [Anaerolentibacter hominis]|uniref:2-hydroxyacid dehydrogenase n=1 Tax=Anaerolentibacter hominis TaxID=3079009 RepID=UPI0031B87F46
MEIAFYSTKEYDKKWFEPLSKEYGYEIRFIESALTLRSIYAAKGCDAVCVFVNDKVTAELVDQMCEMGVKALLLRSAGYNHVDIKAAKGKLPVLRVPSYSPEAVAEFAMAMLLTVNRKTHRAYIRTRDFNMSILGLMGENLYQKTAGVIGTGKIGQAMIRILNGFGMKILAYDIYPNPDLNVEYVSLEELMSRSDVITLHCPLTKETQHIINRDSIAGMKDGVYLINTSRGALVNSEDLIEALKEKKFAGVGLDVYEEEEDLFYEDHSNDVVEDDVLARLMSFPNVLITSHQGFFTEEATRAIALVTLENARAVEEGSELVNEVQWNK